MSITITGIFDVVCLVEHGWRHPYQLFRNVDPLEDQFEKRRQEKKERVAKNEYQRLKNIARNQKGKIKGTIGSAFSNLVVTCIQVWGPRVAQYTGRTEKNSLC